MNPLRTGGLWEGTFMHFEALRRAMLAPRILLAAMLVTSSLSFATAPADACRPMSWICPLNGNWYSSCGGVVTIPPIVRCAEDTVRELTLP